MDGLDEVSDLRSEVAGHVDAFADRYAKKGNLIGLASRPRGYESVETQLRRVGLAGRGLVSAGFWESLQKALPGVEWVDVENEICALRAQKSPQKEICQGLRQAILKKFTGIGPKPDIQAVQKGYMACLHWEHWRSLESLKKLSGIGPTEEMIQDGYVYCLGQGRFFIAGKLREFTGVGPVMDEDMEESVQGWYSWLLAHGNVKKARKLKEFSDADPSEELLKKYPELAEALE
jgi:hypothetical protein